MQIFPTLHLDCGFIHTNNESLRASGTCDPGWSDAHFVNMGCLYFGTKAMDIHEANEFCGLNTSAHLVEILTSEQMDFLIMELQFLEVYTGPRDYWGGGTDFGREGQWYWMNSLSPVDDFVWGSTEPNGNVTENYHEFRYTRDYMLEDINQNNTNFPICQRN